MRVGAIGESERFPAEPLAQLFGIEIEWQARSLDVRQLAAHGVEAILFNVETIESLAMAQLFHKVRSIRPGLPIFVSIGWRREIIAVSEVRSFRVVHDRHFRRLGLTPRESEVLDRIRAGKTNHEIADLLGTSVSTVNRHVENILRKLHARNRAEAAVLSSEWIAS